MVVKAVKPDVTDERIESYINREMLAFYPVTDRAVENGDAVLIDYVGKKDDVAFEGGTAEGYTLNIGTGTFIPGFEEGLIGVMPGETVDLDLTFPADYPSADLAGAEVVFTVTVREIQVSTDYETVTQEQLSSLGYVSKEEVWKEATKVLEESAQLSYESSIANAIMEKRW
ncbi:MAG: FKBP-type peptidyl-prolyl cis-trans isomerase, partial [Lachnospiraceae bacterium]|nr:FKBP-type peptidyl-prolyl cis-trans isomerase [Lachnospiraceae bacterium]